MVISQDSKSHRVAVWYLQAMRIKTRGSHLTCNKGLNVCERVEGVERKKMVHSFPLLSRESSVYVKENPALREKFPNTEFFLVRIFLYSDQKKLRIWTLFTQC